jgi:hypothetical protein
LVEAFQRVLGVAQAYLFADQPVGHAVVMAVELGRLIASRSSSGDRRSKSPRPGQSPSRGSMRCARAGRIQAA